MTTQVPAQCFACTRLRPSSDPDTGTPTAGVCAAYPEGIPLDILLGADHRTARGDERDGLTFEQAGTDEARDAFRWWEKTYTAPA